MSYEGGCHCGNLSVKFETAEDAARLPIRECGCTFCRKHGATAVVIFPADIDTSERLA